MEEAGTRWVGAKIIPQRWREDIETKDTPGRNVIKQKMNSDINEGGTNTKEVKIQRSTRNNNLQNKTGTIQ